MCYRAHQDSVLANLLESSTWVLADFWGKKIHNKTANVTVTSGNPRPAAADVVGHQLRTPSLSWAAAASIINMRNSFFFKVWTSAGVCQDVVFHSDFYFEIY